MQTFSDPAQKQVYQNVRARVLASMETGQHSVARTTLREYAEHSRSEAASIVADVQEAYGIRL